MLEFKKAAKTKRVKKRKSKKARKKAISPVVATVLLIVITVLGVTIIASIIVPLVDQTSGTCFQARDHLKIMGDLGDVKTCFKEGSPPEPPETTVIVKRGTENTELTGFQLILAKQGESQVFSIINGTASSELRVKYYGQEYGTSGTDTDYPITIPEKGTEKTYIIDSSSLIQNTNEKVIKIEIAPILGGKVCSITDSMDEIEDCQTT